jgi:hypothetical protein
MDITQRRRGRPATHLDPKLIGTLGWKGLGLADVALAMGITRQALHTHMKQDPDLRAAYQSGAQGFHERTMAEAADIVAAAKLVMGALRETRPK